MNRTELKNNAKKSLNNHYGDAIIIILLTSIISNVVTVVPSSFAGGFQGIGEVFGSFFLSGAGFFMSLISFALAIIVPAFLTFGSLSFFLKISRNEKADYRELFTKFDMAVPYILITLVTSIFVMLWSLLFIIPGIIAALSYTLVYFIALDNPEMDVLDVIKRSKEMMMGYKFEYFILQLSFMGWIILGLFTCGILYFWLIPYMYVTNCNFYNHLLKEYEKKNNIAPKKKATVIEEKKEITPKENTSIIAEDKKQNTTSKKNNSSKLENSTKAQTKKTTPKSATSKTSTAKKTTTKSSTAKKTTTKPKNTNTKKTTNKKDTK